MVNPVSWIKNNRIPARHNPLLIVRHHQFRPLQQRQQKRFAVGVGEDFQTGCRGIQQALEFRKALVPWKVGTFAKQTSPFFIWEYPPACVTALRCPSVILLPVLFILAFAA